MEFNRYKFNPSQAYRLISVTNHDGSEKNQEFYKRYIHAVAIKLRYDDYPTDEKLCRMKMNFVLNAEDQWMFGTLHTSRVWKVVETEHGIQIFTGNSIYTLEKTVLKQPEFLDAAVLIELYFSLSEPLIFCKGVYYDEKKRPHELTADKHLGLFMDTVLVRFSENAEFGEYLCRYYLQRPTIEFYDTLYHQQEYDIPLFIHNVGKEELQIEFEGDIRIWPIKPGESKMIFPSDIIENDDAEK